MKRLPSRVKVYTQGLCKKANILRILGGWVLLPEGTIDMER